MKQNQRLSFTAWTTIIGVIVSLLLAIIPLIFNQNISLSLLIGIVGMAATYLFDVGIKVRENEELISSRTESLQTSMSVLVEREGDEIKRAIKLGEYLTKDDALRKTIEEIVDACENVKSLNVDAFTRKTDDYLRKCNKLINDLSDGEEVLKSNFSFLPAERCLHKSIAQVVMSTEPLYLNSVFGRKMIEKQKECINLNRNITFIWLQEKHILEDPKFRQLVQEQQNAKVEVLIAEKENISKDLWKDYGIVDDKYYYISSFDNGKPDTDNISTNQDTLHSLEEDLIV